MKRGKHTSLDKELKLSVKWLESFDFVEKVILGRCECARHKYPPGHLRHQMDALGGIKINAYGGRGVVDIYVKVNEQYKPALLKKLTERFPP